MQVGYTIIPENLDQEIARVLKEKRIFQYQFFSNLANWGSGVSYGSYYRIKREKKAGNHVLVKLANFWVNRDKVEWKGKRAPKQEAVIDK